MKQHTFEEYKAILESVAPCGVKARERILDYAHDDKSLDLLEFVQLLKLAYPVDF